ncbi:MAG: penicillin-binding protein 2 [Rhodospirillaceae bacterium]
MTITAHRLAAKRHHMEGIRKQALDTGRSRLLLTGMVFAVAFAGIAGRLVDLTVLSGGGEPRTAALADTGGAATGRANIVDRNGIILAASLPTVSLSADPAEVIAADEAATGLASVFETMSRDEILQKLTGKGRFVWLARNLTPKQHQDVIRLGIPGLQFHRGERRVYPHGALVSHVLGVTDVDGFGIAGIENQFDRELRSGAKPLRLSLDVRVQAILHEELMNSVAEFKAIGAAGLVMDVETSEIVAMVSLPDFDPNRPDGMVGEAVFNRAAKGVYEMGSTFKLFTAAMALDSGTVAIDGGYDASQPIRVARFSISDYHAQNRWLSVPDIILHSSNIGAAKMAVDVGGEAQRRYLGRFGLLEPAKLELPEVGAPLLPSVWRPINTMTISYGHGISVSPVQVASGVAALVNGGVFRTPTLLKAADHARSGEQVITAETSSKMRGLMRLVVSQGTGRKANIQGYLIGGKTGTAEKIARRGYSQSAKIVSFVGAFPMNAPRYVVLAIVDEPIGNKRTFNYATGGWVAAPVVGKVIERIGPLVGIAPDPKAEIDLPATHVARAPAPAPVQPQAKVRTASWAQSVALAVGGRAGEQTAAEERLVLKTRQALGRAVSVSAAQKPLVSTVRSTLERNVATH